MIDAPVAFAWCHLEPLLGEPFGTGLLEVFAQAGIDSKTVMRERRVGIESMPPAVNAPPEAFEVDLQTSHHIRLSFRTARTLDPNARGLHAPEEQLFSACTYFLPLPDGQEGEPGVLPYGIVSSDAPDDVTARVGREPTSRRLDPQSTYGSIAWEDKLPVVHVLFTMATVQATRVNIFLPLLDQV